MTPSTPPPSTQEKAQHVQELAATLTKHGTSSEHAHRIVAQAQRDLDKRKGSR